MGREAEQVIKRRGRSFFKVLIDDFSNQLEIPKAFVKYFGAVHRKIKLCSHARRFWLVDVEKVGNCLFFQNGWEAFVKDHQLEVGDFLVFTKTGKSKYNVKIFGINGCRKEVEVADNEDHKPLSCNENKKVMRERQHRAVRRNMERDGEGRLGESPRSDKAQVIEIEDDSDVSIEILDEVPPKSPVLNTLPKGISPESGSGVRSTNRTSHHYKIPGMAAAEERANAFKSENPFFVVPMIQGYSLEYVHVPAEFARKYLGGKHSVNVTLRVSEERKWTVKYKKSPRRKVVDARFSTGWKVFVQDNHLKADDVCVYELIKGPANTFDVVIFRAFEDYPLDNSSGHEEPIIEPKAEESDDISVEILGESLPRKRRGTICRTSTSANLHPSAICFDTNGAHSKSIKVERKLHQSEQDFEVHPSKPGLVNPEGKASVQPSPISTSSSRAEEASDEKYPFFRVTISMPYMMNTSLNVPIRIGRLISGSSITAKLKFADGFWPVKLITYHNCQTKFSSGWPQFIKDNAIRKGDECLFELVDAYNGLFKVSVLRH